MMIYRNNYQQYIHVLVYLILSNTFWTIPTCTVTDVTDLHMFFGVSACGPCQVCC